MDELELGPNGGLVYCMEYLLDNMDWLKDELDKFDDDEYIIFDCPGQVHSLVGINRRNAFFFQVHPMTMTPDDTRAVLLIICDIKAGVVCSTAVFAACSTLKTITSKYSRKGSRPRCCRRRG